MRKGIRVALFTIVLALTGTSRGESLPHPADTKPLPANLEAERSVLGAILLDNEAFLVSSSVLKGKEFSLNNHRIIFRAMQQMSVLGMAVDLLTLTNFLNVNGWLQDVGDSGYLATLTDGVPRMSNVREYAEIVRGDASRREFIHCCDSLMRQAWDGSDSIADVMESAIGKILSLNSDAGGPQVRSFAHVTESAMRELQEQIESDDNSFAIRSGLKELDRTVHGFRRGEIVLIVGPSSHGKTLLGEQIAMSADRDGFKGIFFSAEMRGEEIALRELTWSAGIKHALIRRPDKLRQEEYREELESLRRAAKEPLGKNLKIVDRDITPAKVWALSELHKRTDGLDYVIVDYDQLVVDAGTDDPAERFQNQRRFMLEAKRMVGKLDICFFLIAQLRKLSPGIIGGERPTLDDIYGDSTMRNTPQVVLFVLREFFLKKMNPKFERVAKIFVLKNRSGRTGAIELEFDPDLVRLKDKEEGIEIADPPEDK